MSALLSHEETMALIERSKAGCESAREQLVVRNTALIKSIVKGYLYRGAEFEDLMQIGSIGLLKAIDGYDPSFGVRFSTYAVPMIAGEIKRFLRDDGIVKVSRYLKENAIKIYRATEALKKQLGREPTLGEIGERTGLAKEDIVSSLEAVREPVSIYEPVFEEGDATLLDTMEKDDGAQMIDRLLIKELIGKLAPRERQVVVLRYFGDKTQSEIAEAIGVSQVQVSRILSKTLLKLREAAQ